MSSCIWGACDKEPLLRKPFDDRSWQTEIGSQHIGRIRGHPRAEVMGMVVPIVEGDQQAQDPATSVADVVSGAHRHVTDVTSHELFGYCVTNAPTGRCPWGSTVSVGRSCSHLSRAAMGFADRKNKRRCWSSTKIVDDPQVPCLGPRSAIYAARSLILASAATLIRAICASLASHVARTPIGILKS